MLTKIPTLTRPDWASVADIAEKNGGSLTIPGPENDATPYTMNGAHASLYRFGFAICQHPDTPSLSLVYRRVKT